MLSQTFPVQQDVALFPDNSLLFCWRVNTSVFFVKEIQWSREALQGYERGKSGIFPVFSRLSGNIIRELGRDGFAADWKHRQI